MNSADFLSSWLSARFFALLVVTIMTWHSLIVAPLAQATNELSASERVSNEDLQRKVELLSDKVAKLEERVASLEKLSNTMTDSLMGLMSKASDVVSSSAVNSRPTPATEKDAELVLQALILKDARVPVEIVSVKKENGIPSIMSGSHIFVLEYEAILRFPEDCYWWAVGTTGWRGNMSIEPFESKNSPKRNIKQGEKLRVTSSIVFYHTEKGWRLWMLGEEGRVSRFQDGSDSVSEIQLSSPSSPNAQQQTLVQESSKPEPTSVEFKIYNDTSGTLQLYFDGWTTSTELAGRKNMIKRWKLGSSHNLRIVGPLGSIEKSIKVQGSVHALRIHPSDFR